MRRLLLSVALMLIATPALAGGITVSHAMLRTITPAVPAAGYFDLRNGTATAITLTGARSSACGDMMMHRSDGEGGMMRMAMTPQIAVAPGARLSFRPGSYHLMCEHPSPALFTAHAATVTLTFQGGTMLDVTFAVVDAKGTQR